MTDQTSAERIEILKQILRNPETKRHERYLVVWYHLRMEYAFHKHAMAKRTLDYNGDKLNTLIDIINFRNDMSEL